MKIGSPRQLKDWISNMAKKNNLVANQNVLIAYYYLKKVVRSDELFQYGYGICETVSRT